MEKGNQILLWKGKKRERKVRKLKRKGEMKENYEHKPPKPFENLPQKHSITKKQILNPKKAEKKVFNPKKKGETTGEERESNREEERALHANFC